MTSPRATGFSPRIETAEVLCNVRLCREHYRLTLALTTFPAALPGQFVQLSPSSTENGGPLLPRAFSVGGLRRTAAACEIDIIYRVVGAGTTWMESLRAGHSARVLGPLGRPFRISDRKPRALLVIGGVGLAPLMWLAEALHKAGKDTVALLGAQTHDLVPLDMVSRPAPSPDAKTPVPCSSEFAALDIPVILSTDDGSCGFAGNVVQALAAYWSPTAPTEDVVVYTCGPERMMQATAEFCLSRRIACQVCMERPMACGMGTCQSCIVTVRSDQYERGWRYALCCSEGPVFDAEQIIWNGGH